MSRTRAPARARESSSAPAGARELVVVWRGIEALIPYARNARTHSDEQIAQIAGSIREFGFTNPVLIDVDIHSGWLLQFFTRTPFFCIVYRRPQIQS